LGLLLEVAFMFGEFNRLATELKAEMREPTKGDALRRIADAEAKLGIPGALELEYREVVAATEGSFEEAQRMSERIPTLSIQMRSFSAGFAVLAVFGEAAALVALAADQTSAFLLLTTALSTECSSSSLASSRSDSLSAKTGTAEGAVVSATLRSTVGPTATAATGGARCG
jgi:hypothetical protein